MTPAGTSNELDVQNGWEENTHTHCRESVGTGPVVLKAVRVTGAAFASPRTKYYCAPLFSHTHYWYTVIIFKLSGVYQNISTVSIFKLSGVYQNISTAVLQLFCGIVFSNPPTYSLWSERVKSSVHTAQQYHHMLDFKT